MGGGPLRGKVVLLTGATGGIGSATARLLAREGMRLMISGRNEARLRALEAELRGLGCEAVGVAADVADRSQVRMLADATTQRFSRVDLLVCNAGEYVRGPAERLHIEDFERSMAVNFYGTVHLVYAVLPGMLASGSGHIVAVSSVDGKKGLPLDAPYVAAKFAVTGFMDVLRQELRGTGVRATTVLPGRVDTPMIGRLEVPRISAKIPAERVARAIVSAVRKKKGEVIVPFGGPRFLVVTNSISSRAGDWLVQAFGLQGRVTASGLPGGNHSMKESMS